MPTDADYFVFFFLHSYRNIAALFSFGYNQNKSNICIAKTNRPHWQTRLALLLSIPNRSHLHVMQGEFQCSRASQTNETKRARACCAIAHSTHSATRAHTHVTFCPLTRCVCVRWQCDRSARGSPARAQTRWCYHRNCSPPLVAQNYIACKWCAHIIASVLIVIIAIAHRRHRLLGRARSVGQPPEHRPEMRRASWYYVFLLLLLSVLFECAEGLAPSAECISLSRIEQTSYLAFGPIECPAHKANRVVERQSQVRPHMWRAIRGTEST